MNNELFGYQNHHAAVMVAWSVAAPLRRKADVTILGKSRGIPKNISVRQMSKDPQMNKHQKLSISKRIQEQKFISYVIFEPCKRVNLTESQYLI